VLQFHPVETLAEVFEIALVSQNADVPEPALAAV
jgi:hypothetical protein